MSDMSEAPVRKTHTAPQDTLNILADVTVRLSVEVGATTMTLAQLANIDVGTVITLDRQVNEPLDICANGARVARGEIVAADGRYAIRIVDLLTTGQPGSLTGKQP